MTCLPIVERELRVRARLRSTYRLRVVAANGAFLLVVALLLMASFGFRSGQYGAMVFHILAWGAFVLCLTDGARNTADSLGEEKREGTLGLLFLTDLRPFDVILGKLLATSLNSFYGLLAIFPPMAVPLLIGGVTFDEFWRLALVLLNTLFFSLALGMAVSAGLRDDRQAWSLAMGITIAWGVLPTLLGLLPGWSSSWLTALSPTTGLLSTFDAAYIADPGRYWQSVGWVHLLGWAFLVVATLVLPRAWQDRPREWTGSRWKRFFAKDDGEEASRKDLERRRMILDGNPAVWLVVRRQRKMTVLWLVIVGTCVCAVTTWLLTGGATIMAASLFGVMLLLHLAVAIWVGTEACHLFSGVRDSGALEILLCTPLPARLVVQGHLEGLRQRFYRPVAVLVTVELVLLGAQIYLLGASGSSMGVCLGVLMVVGLAIAVSLADMAAVAHFGLWQGLANRKPSRAVTKTLLYVLILPLAFGPFLPIAGLFKNIFFINYAQQRLRKQFRSLLTGRYGWGQESEFVDRPKPRKPFDRLPSVWVDGK